MKQTTHKAWAAAVTTLLGALLYQFAGVGEAPAAHDVESAIVAVLSSVVAAAAAYGATWIVPNKPKAALFVAILGMSALAGCATTLGDGQVDHAKLEQFCKTLEAVERGDPEAIEELRNDLGDAAPEARLARILLCAHVEP